MSRIRQSEGRPRRRAREQTRASPTIRSLALRLPAGHRLPSHNHDWAQFVFAARGVMAVQAGSKQWVVPPLRGVWLPAGTRHGLDTIGETWMRTLYVRPDLASSIHATIRVVEVPPLLRELILEIVRIGTLDESDEFQRGLTGVFMALIRRSPELGLGLPMPRDARAQAIARRIQRDPSDQSPLIELVRGTGASSRTAERLFVKETGLPLGSWRQQARLQLAVQRLAEGESVTNVSLECGYDSVSAFVTMFKRSMGVTPGRYIATEA